MTVMTRLKSAAAAAVLIATASMGAASAATFTGSGYWGTGTPSTTYSAANEVFTFGFDIPDTFSGTTYSGSIDTTDFTNFYYKLNNVDVASAPSSIQFYDIAAHGMFDINFSDATVSIYGADVASGGTVTSSGYFATSAGVNGAYPGSADGSVEIAIAPSAPEPASWVLMIAGVGLAGAAMRRRKALEASALQAA